MLYHVEDSQHTQYIQKNIESHFTILIILATLVSM